MRNIKVKDVVREDPIPLVSRSLAEMAVRQRYDFNVLLVRTENENGELGPPHPPEPSYRATWGDSFVVFGPGPVVDRMQNS